MIQNPSEATFHDCYEQFPQRLSLSLNYLPDVIEERTEGLEHFIYFFLEHADIINQNSINALCAFLEVFIIIINH